MDEWFGRVPMDEGSIAPDFDPVFESLSLSWAATGPKDQNPSPTLMQPSVSTPYNHYNGTPLPKYDVLK